LNLHDRPNRDFDFDISRPSRGTGEIIRFPASLQGKKEKTRKIALA
jgi:hypothetical protein